MQRSYFDLVSPEQFKELRREACQLQPPLDSQRCQVVGGGDLAGRRRGKEKWNFRDGKSDTAVSSLKRLGRDSPCAVGDLESKSETAGSRFSPQPQLRAASGERLAQLPSPLHFFRAQVD